MARLPSWSRVGIDHANATFHSAHSILASQNTEAYNRRHRVKALVGQRVDDIQIESVALLAGDQRGGELPIDDNGTADRVMRWRKQTSSDWTYSRLKPSGASCTFETVSLAEGPIAASATTARARAERSDQEVMASERER